MIYPSEIIKKLYYFVTDKVIYEISSRNDTDGCGISAGFNADGSIKTNSELAAIFPYIKLTYTTYKEDGSVNKSGQEKYLWLQDYIKDGDGYEDGVFKCKKDLHGDDSETFVARYIKKVKNEINEYIKNGYSVQSIRNMFPKYFSGVPYDDFMDEKVTVTATSLGSNDIILNNTNINKLYEDVAKQEATNSANRILNCNGKKVKNLTLTTENK